MLKIEGDGNEQNLNAKKKKKILKYRGEKLNFEFSTMHFLQWLAIGSNTN